MSDTHIYDQLGEALKSQRERFGGEAFENRRRLVSLLADTLPDARREIRAIASALDEGVLESLQSVERGLLGMEMDRQADRLEQAIGLRPDLAKQVVRALAYALGLGPAPSVYEAAQPAAAPSPSSDAWAGVSEVAAPNAAQHSAAAPQAPRAGAKFGPSTVLFNVMGRAVTALHAGAAALAVVLVVIAIPMFTGQSGGPNSPARALQATEYAGELTDTGVAPKNTLESNVGTPTPVSIPGGQRVTTVQLHSALGSDRSILLIDVLGDAHQSTIQGAQYLPAAGLPGSFNDTAQTQTADALENLTGGDRDRTLVFFCAGSACWESYNAVLRARAAGYTRLYWYRGGLASWRAASLPMQPLPQPLN